MMPFQNMNPNYYAWSQQYFPQQNPYMQRMENLQQFQQTINPIPQTSPAFQPLGKIVESEEVVRSTEIPMDGNMYYFPTADGSAVYGKRWLSNGQTQILAFKPISEPNPINVPSDSAKVEISAFGDVLDGIQSEIKSLSDKIDKLNRSSKGKKEVAEDE